MLKWRKLHSNLKQPRKNIWNRLDVRHSTASKMRSPPKEEPLQLVNEECKITVFYWMYVFAYMQTHGREYEDECLTFVSFVFFADGLIIGSSLENLRSSSIFPSSRDQNPDSSCLFLALYGSSIVSQPWSSTTIRLRRVRRGWRKASSFPMNKNVCICSHNVVHRFLYVCRGTLW
jgi:hypothetical protein